MKCVLGQIIKGTHWFQHGSMVSGCQLNSEAGTDQKLFYSWIPISIFTWKEDIQPVLNVWKRVQWGCSLSFNRFPTSFSALRFVWKTSSESCQHWKLIVISYYAPVQLRGFFFNLLPSDMLTCLELVFFPYRFYSQNRQKSCLGPSLQSSK